MLRYKTIIVSLICLSIFTLFFMHSLRRIGVHGDYSIPISGLNNLHDIKVDIINPNIRRKGTSVQNPQTTAVRNGNEIIDRFEDVYDTVNINGTTFTLGDKQTPTEELCKLCRKSLPVFIDEPKPFIALASYPCSGNSWTRELLEYITGVYTGSVYVDARGQFPGSKRCPLRGGVYIVKTHIPGNGKAHHDCRGMHSRAKMDYQKAMFILRNPYDALLSFFNYMNGGGKVDLAPRHTFQTKWRTFVSNATRGWQNMTLYWMTKFERPLHVIVYEQLKEDTPNQLFKVGKFLHLNSTFIDLYCAKSCLKSKYHRVTKPEWMSPSILFDDALREVVNAAIREVIHSLEEGGDIVKVLKSYFMQPGV